MESSSVRNRRSSKPPPTPVPAEKRLATLRIASKNGTLPFYVYLKASLQLLLLQGAPPVRIAAVWDMWEACPTLGKDGPTHIIVVKAQQLPFLWHPSKAFPFYSTTLDEYKDIWAEMIMRLGRERHVGESNECSRLLDQFQCGEFPIDLQKELTHYHRAASEGLIDVDHDVNSLLLTEPNPEILANPTNKITLGFCTFKAIENYALEHRRRLEEVAEHRAAFRTIRGWLEKIALHAKVNTGPATVSSKDSCIIQIHKLA